MEQLKLFTPIFKFALREDLKEDKIFLPKRAEEKASGWDVRAAMEDRKPLIIEPFQYAKIPLGIRGFCPDGWWYEMKPRSSSFSKKNLHSLYGTIDETYSGQLIYACQYIPEIKFETDSCYKPESSWNSISIKSKTYATNDNLVINFGDAIAQIIPIRRQEMQVLESSNEEYDSDCAKRNAARGAGGWGSTDK